MHSLPKCYAQFNLHLELHIATCHIKFWGMGASSLPWIRFCLAPDMIAIRNVGSSIQLWREDNIIMILICLPQAKFRLQVETDT